MPLTVSNLNRGYLRHVKRAVAVAKSITVNQLGNDHPAIVGIMIRYSIPFICIMVG